MAEYIEREALYKEISELEELARKRVIDTPCTSPAYMRYVAQLNERTAIKQLVSDAPAADVAPVVHGRWIDRTGPDDDLNVTDTCSVCLHTDTHSPTVDVPYCWHCGARMDKEEN